MNNSKHIYLDYSATTPIDAEVLKVITTHLAETYGNASSVHAYGRKAKVVMEESREIIARSINAEPSEIFFTSGGTEADNHALIGAAFAMKRKKGKNHLLVSAIEHHAVLDTADYLKKFGFLVSYIPVDSTGRVVIEEVKSLVTTNTGIISVMHANNETGVMQPLHEIALIAKEHDLLFHSDAVQTFGKIPIDVKELPLDLLTLSAHKIYGPKGIGAIYIRKGTNIDSLLHGGAQERNNRAGTENVPFVAGFAKAVEISLAQMHQHAEHASLLNSRMRKIIEESVEGAIINSSQQYSLPHILNVALESSVYDTEAETMLLNMDLHGVAVSSGSACTSGSIQPSHVLLAMGLDEKSTRSAIRFSFGRYTTLSEVEKAGEIYCSITQTLQKKVHSIY